MFKYIYFSLYDGFKVSLLTLISTFFLDLTSFNYVSKLLKQTNGLDLYIKGIVCSLINNLFLGSLLYEFVSSYLNKSCPEDIFIILFEIFSIMFIQSIGYSIVHKIMHQPKFYWIHKFHHSFSSIVLPSSANAVSLLEYMLAYMLPIITSIYLVKPYQLSLYYSVNLISIINLLIHTPWLRHISRKIIPKYLVSTDNHQSFRTNYSAPIFNIDRILSLS